MTRLSFILWLLIFNIAGLHCLTAADPALPPNILLIVADDLNCAIGPYGDAIANTPNLDRLAAVGLTFDRAYCQQAVCNPSRSSFLTGLRPNTVGVDDLRKYFRDTAPDGSGLVTLPQHFRHHGYFCQNVGKIFHNMGDTQDRVSWSIDEAFDKGTHADDTVFRNRLIAGLKPAMKAPVTEALPVPDTAYRDGQIANLAAATIRDHPAEGQPFFLAVGFWRPHLPFVAPKRYWDLYDAESIPMPVPSFVPAGAPPIAIHDSREIQGYGDKRPATQFSAADIRHFRHGYYASISFLDAQVGKLLDALEESAHAEKTIIVFTSDHGFHIGEHALWGKTSNFELDARVPLIIAAPQFPKAAGQRTQALCELIDLYPTLSELTGVSDDLPQNLEGVSLVPLFKDPEGSVKSYAVTQHQQPFYGSSANWKAWGYSLRSNRWRFTEWRDTSSGHVVAQELYDHRNDPLETRNVAADSQYDDVVKQLSAALTPYIAKREGGQR